MLDRQSLPQIHNILADLERRSSSPQTRLQPVSLTRGSVLFKQEDPANGCYWLRRGAVKVGVTSRVGHERIIAVLGAGAIVGELATLNNRRHSATVSALVDSELVFVSDATFAGILHDHPEFKDFLIGTMVDRLQRANEEAASSPFLPVKARVARAVLNLAGVLGRDEGPDVVAIHKMIRQEDLAAMAGVTRENVSRTVSDWRRRGVIRPSSRDKFMFHKTLMRRESLAKSSRHVLS